MQWQHSTVLVSNTVIKEALVCALRGLNSGFIIFIQHYKCILPNIETDIEEYYGQQLRSQGGLTVNSCRSISK